MITVYITFKSGKTQIDSATNVKIDVSNGVILLNYGLPQERVISASLVQYLEMETR